MNPAGLVFGAGVATLSADVFMEGTQRALGTYQSAEGQRVIDALDLATHPGDPSRSLELATELGLAATPWAAGKVISSGAQALRRGVILWCWSKWA